MTANLFVRRNDFEKWGAFDESLPSGGDYDFVVRAVEQGAQLAYAPRAVVRHPTIDDAGSFLRKVWRTNRWAALRRSRQGVRVTVMSILTFVPILGVALARHNTLRPVRQLDPSRLAASGLAPRWLEIAAALAVMYSVVGYTASFARLRGWIDARRLGRSSLKIEPPEESPAIDLKTSAR